MNWGDVWQLDLGGRAGRRPAVILTRQGVIPHLNKLTVAEITSAGKGYPTEVAIGQKANLRRESYVQLDNLQTGSPYSGWVLACTKMSEEMHQAGLFT